MNCFFVIPLFEKTNKVGGPKISIMNLKKEINSFLNACSNMINKGKISSKTNASTILIFFLLFFCTSQQAFGQYSNNRSEAFELPRINKPIDINGLVNEPVWDSVEPLPLISYEPVAGLPPSEPTEIRVVYDDEYLYASIRAFDSEPSEIRINSLYRDRLAGDDIFHITLDTYNDNETGLVFVVTPGGVKVDMSVSDDGAGSDAINMDFNTYWNAATHVDERGWFAEVRIPFRNLGFQSENNEVEMGLYVHRVISRKNERVSFPEVPSNIAQAYFKPSLTQQVIFKNIRNESPLHITPYITGGMEEQNLINESRTGYKSSNNSKLDAGLDIKYGLSNNLKMDLTFNTDFAQVEADDQQVNLSRFDISFPEKRQFFLERAGLFNLDTGGGGLFHSRRIGLTEEGKPIRMLAGGRLTGSIGSWDMGFLNVQTDKFQEVPAENFGVLRLKRKILNPYSYAGTMVTSRVGFDGSYNFGYGFDGSIRLWGNDYFTWAWAQSLEEETRNMSIFDTSRLRLHWERRSREGFAWESTVSRSGRAYNPGVGFIWRLDYFRIGQGFKYNWMPGENSAFQLHGIEMSGAIYWRTTTQQIESMEYGPEWSATTKRGDRLNASLTWNLEDVRESFVLLGKTEILPQEYKFIRVVAGYNMDSSRDLRVGVEADIGTFYDGWRYTLELSPTWNISKHFELEGALLYNLINAGSKEDLFSAYLGQLKLLAAVNNQISVHTFIQVNSSRDLIATNMRFRYNIREGNDFWVVLNRGMNINRYRTNPTMPLTEAQSVLIKYTHTFHY